jgi:hypothetical protein
MGCLVKSEALSKSTEKSQLGADAVRHSNCNALNHPQPFDASSDVPAWLGLKARDLAWLFMALAL